ncbi:hypothetical protein BHM03_00041191 [Ensete ventricosum]|uniref:Uncharacterized protein n=1 Tax=Ensete ventricosum TaxID=4639 RepID=A0A445MKM2_ENSVE|nr:hypothetical protein BHM03_00041191 [Ensete ventricosum]
MHVGRCPLPSLAIYDNFPTAISVKHNRCPPSPLQSSPTGAAQSCRHLTVVAAINLKVAAAPAQPLAAAAINLHHL